MKTLTLKGNINIPILGFGTWNLGGETCYKAVCEALSAGYRHVDTADRYYNHREVGKALSNSGIKRDQLFITSKIFYEDLRAEKVITSGKRFLDELKTDYLDLMLIHWPNKNIPIVETLEALQILKEEGLIRALGVSNFTIHHLEDAAKTGIDVALNQVELHPSFNQIELKEYCDSVGLVLTAYSPLGMGEELQNETVIKLSKKYNVSPAQVILNWITSRGIVAIPKSTNPENIKDNLNSLNWEMENEDQENMNNILQKPRLLAPAFNEFDY